MKVEIKSLSSRSSKATSQSLIDAEFVFAYLPGPKRGEGVFVIDDPNESQLRFLARHYKAHMTVSQD